MTVIPYRRQGGEDFCRNRSLRGDRSCCPATQPRNR